MATTDPGDKRAFVDVVKFILENYSAVGVKCIGDPIKAVHIGNIEATSIRRDYGEQNVPFGDGDKAFIMLHMVSGRDFQLRI